MIHVENVGLKRNNRTIVSDISLKVLPGKVVALLGPNGAGKSSLLKMLAGNLEPSEGDISVNGQLHKQWDATDRARHLAMMSQFSRLTFSFTAEEVVLLGRTPHKTRNVINKMIVQQALERSHASHLAKKKYTELSGGEAQRVNLARALAQVWETQSRGARYLLLDEPTSALDPAHQHHVLQIIKAFSSENIGCVVVLHDLNLAARYADKIILLSDGKIVEQGTPQYVLTPDILRTTFMIETHVTKHPFHPCPLVVM